MANTASPWLPSASSPILYLNASGHALDRIGPKTISRENPGAEAASSGTLLDMITVAGKVSQGDLPDHLPGGDEVVVRSAGSLVGEESALGC